MPLSREFERLRRENANFRKKIAELEKEHRELKQIFEQVKPIIEPPHRYGFFSRYNADGTLDVNSDGHPIRAKAQDTPELKKLKSGDRLILNCDLNVLGMDNTFRPLGVTVTLKNILSDSRVLVAFQMQELEGILVPPLSGPKLKIGDLLLMDLLSRFVFEKLPEEERKDLFLTEIPDVDYLDIGGCEKEIAELREAIEFPRLYPDLFAALKLRPSKGTLLWGPPGCGKTMVAKALAKNLQGRFLLINCPDILNKYLGVPEERIGERFKIAREVASEGHPVVMFFDEIDTIARRRDSGISSDWLASVVPKIMLELDGVIELENVIPVFATNRRDLLDDAFIRPGRVDIEIYFSAPDITDALDIFSKYLIPDLPFGAEELAAADGSAQAAAQCLAQKAVDYLFKEQTRIFSMYNAEDPVTGAVIESAVRRAKLASLRRSIASGDPPAITEKDVMEACRVEITRSEGHLLEKAERHHG